MRIFLGNLDPLNPLPRPISDYKLSIETYKKRIFEDQPKNKDCSQKHKKGATVNKKPYDQEVKKLLTIVRLEGADLASNL